MKSKESNVNFKIEYKNDLESSYKLFDFLIDCLIEIKKKAGEQFDGGKK